MKIFQSFSYIIFSALLLAIHPSLSLASGKVFVCQNTAGSITLPNCGGIGCTITVAQGTLGDPSYTSVNYKVTRTRASNGGFVYRTKSSAVNKCTVALTTGQKSVKTCTCAPTLVKAKCQLTLVP